MKRNPAMNRSINPNYGTPPLHIPGCANSITLSMFALAVHHPHAKWYFSWFTRITFNKIQQIPLPCNEQK